MVEDTISVLEGLLRLVIGAEAVAGSERLRERSPCSPRQAGACRATAAYGVFGAVWLFLR